MFNNSSTASHLDLGNWNYADNSYDLYTTNPSAFSIYTDLNQIVNLNRLPNENLCELSKPEKHSYTKNDLFKIRNEKSDLIKDQVPAVIAQSWAYKTGQPWDPSDPTTQTNSLLTLSHLAASDKNLKPDAGKILLSLIKNPPKPQETGTFVPNKKKSDPIQQFVLEHPDLLNECSEKRKLPSAMTVQQVESNLICNIRSSITVQELESMQLNQTIYEDPVLVNKHSDEMDLDDQSNQLSEQYEMSIDLKSSDQLNEKQHFNFLIEKLRAGQY